MPAITVVNFGIKHICFFNTSLIDYLKVYPIFFLIELNNPGNWYYSIWIICPYLIKIKDKGFIAPFTYGIINNLYKL